MYNLIMTGQANAWNGTPYRLELTRFGEHTEPAVLRKFKDLDDKAINELSVLPCLFAYEKDRPGNARVGIAKAIVIRQGFIQIRYDFVMSIPGISNDFVIDHAWDFGVDRGEIYRTHWAVKDMDLIATLNDFNLIPKESLSKLLADFPSPKSHSQYPSCFISFSSKNQDFADRLHEDFEPNDVHCWFAPHDMQGGKKVHEQIDQAIRVYDKLLLILSKDSMGSAWVGTEIYKARQRELKENRKILFPVSLVPFREIQEWELFDADSGKDLAREIREYYIPDFSNWDSNGLYQKEFNKLLRDLKNDHPQQMISSNNHPNIFLKAQLQMPELFAEMSTDLKNKPLIREFFAISKKWVMGGFSRPCFLYYFEDHEQLLNKTVILENYGFIQDVTPGNAKKYRMTEEFAEYLLSL